VAGKQRGETGVLRCDGLAEARASPGFWIGSHVIGKQQADKTQERSRLASAGTSRKVVKKLKVGGA
jgi:hypothetical protein